MSVLTSIDAQPDPELLREAYGAFPCGVVAVAAVVDGIRVGLAASSFTTVSLVPPLVSFSVANTSATWPLLRRAARLGLSVLAEGHGDICRQLAGPADHRFDDLATTTGEQGAVVLDDAVTSFGCSIRQEIEAGDHTIVLLRLHSIEDTGDALPLVFHRSGFGRLTASI